MFEVGTKYTPNELIQIISECIPDFKRACEYKEVDAILMHQDAFAASLQFEEILLLGMAIKFAGLYGREVSIIGTHNATLKP